MVFAPFGWVCVKMRSHVNLNGGDSGNQSSDRLVNTSTVRTRPCVDGVAHETLAEAVELTGGADSVRSHVLPSEPIADSERPNGQRRLWLDHVDGVTSGT